MTPGDGEYCSKSCCSQVRLDGGDLQSPSRKKTHGARNLLEGECRQSLGKWIRNEATHSARHPTNQSDLLTSGWNSLNFWIWSHYQMYATRGKGILSWQIFQIFFPSPAPPQSTLLKIPQWNLMQGYTASGSTKISQIMVKTLTWSDPFLKTKNHLKAKKK